MISFPSGARTAAALAATALVVTFVPGQADADPVGDAKARAAGLAKTVQQLQIKAELATERYDAIEDRLGRAVTDRMLAQRDLDSAQAGTDAAVSMSEDRVRALYEAGGPTSLFATVLDGSDLTDALSRYHDIGLVLGTDQEHIDDHAAQAARAESVAARLAATAAQVTDLQKQAARAAAQVQGLVDAAQQALDAANGQVRQLVAQAAAAAAAASAASFEQAVRDAGGSLSPDMTPPNATAARVIAAAKTKLGDPYQWGGTGPDAYDCSGLTQFAYGSAGIQLPRVASDQWSIGTHVGLGDLLPGDLLFWASDPADPGTIHHVAIYVGGGMMIAAPHTGDVVKVEPVYMDGYIGATRPWQPA